MNKFSDFHMNWKRGLKSKLKQAGKKHKYDKCIFIGTGGIKRVGINYDHTNIHDGFTTRRVAGIQDFKSVSLLYHSCLQFTG